MALKAGLMEAIMADATVPLDTLIFPIGHLRRQIESSLVSSLSLSLRYSPFYFSRISLFSFVHHYFYFHSLIVFFTFISLSLPLIPYLCHSFFYLALSLIFFLSFLFSLFYSLSLLSFFDHIALSKG